MKFKRSSSLKNISSNMSVAIILKSLILAYVISLIAFLIEGGIIHFTKVSEDIIPLSVSIISGLSILFAGIYIAKKTESRGWLNGGLVGLLYILIITIISYFLIPGYQVELAVLGRMIIGFIMGAVGGIIGVNL